MGTAWWQLYIPQSEQITMVFPQIRTMLAEIVHTVNPWRHAAAGSTLLTNSYGVGLSGFGGDAAVAPLEQEDIFGSLWFAVPKKRVSRWYYSHVSKL